MDNTGIPFPWVFPLLFLFIAIPSQLKANDSLAQVAAGGIQFMETVDISMEEEHLSISLEKVEVSYLFKNLKEEDILATVAFPVPEYGFHFDEVLARYPRGFSDFKVFVEGEEIPYKKNIQAFVGGKNYASELEEAGISVVDFGDYHPAFGVEEWIDDIERLNNETISRLQKLGLIGPEPEPDWPNWKVKIAYYWEQLFPAGTTIEIKHTYSPYYGGYQTQFPHFQDEIAPKACFNEDEIRRLKNRWPEEGWGTIRYVPYILTTGGNWKGAIKDFKLSIEFEEGMVAGLCFSKPLTLISTGRKTAELKNFRPNSDIDVYFVDTPSEK